MADILPSKAAEAKRGGDMTNIIDRNSPLVQHCTYSGQCASVMCAFCGSSQDNYNDSYQTTGM
jgi:hypothetical protein